MMAGRLFAYAIAAALILGGAYLAWRHYAGLVDEKAALTGKLATQEQLTRDAQQATLEQNLANAELRADLERTNRLLADREGRRQQLQHERDSANAQLDALKSNPEAAAWMAMRIPDPVLRVLRGEPSGGPGRGPQDGAAKSPREPDPPDAGAVFRGIDQRGPGQLGRGPQRSAGPVQRGQGVDRDVVGVRAACGADAVSAFGKYLRLQEGGYMAFRCPGCKIAHSVRVGDGPSSCWGFNGSEEKPSFTPSVLVRSGHYAGHHAAGDECWCTYNAAQVKAGEPPSGFTCEVCHSFVTDGRIQFLGDCTHALAGQTVDLPVFDDEEPPPA